MAYISNNFETLSKIKLKILNIAVILNLVIIVFVAIKEIDKLKDL